LEYADRSDDDPRDSADPGSGGDDDDDDDDDTGGSADTGDPIDTDGPWTGTGCPVDASGRDDAFLFADDILDVELSLSAEAIAGLADDAEDDVPPVEATFMLGLESSRVGLSLRGGRGSFRSFEEKPAFEIDFDTFEAGARFHGLRTLVLKNMAQDDAMLEEWAGLSL
jgi:hypothetical protein